MDTEKPYITLSNAIEPLKFGLTLEQDNRVLVKYEEYADEYFDDFYSYMNALSQYYRNRIDITEDIEKKIRIANVFIDHLTSYKINFRNLLKDEDKLLKEAAFHKDIFEYYIKRFKEKASITVASENNKRHLTTKQIILIFEYLGITKEISKICPTNQTLYKILSATIGRDEDNIKKIITNIEYTAADGKGIKYTRTPTNLTAVMDFFNEVGLIEIADKVKNDIAMIKKG